MRHDDTYHSTIKFFLDPPFGTPQPNPRVQALEQLRVALMGPALAEAKDAVINDRLTVAPLVDLVDVASHWEDTRTGWRRLAMALSDCAPCLPTASKAVRRAMKLALLAVIDHVQGWPNDATRDGWQTLKPSLEQCRVGLLAGAHA
jgi:hypothetical protein